MKKLILLLSLVCVLALPLVAVAKYPQKNITMIVPFAAGGNTDIVARALVPSLEKVLEGKIIIKNESVYF